MADPYVVGYADIDGGIADNADILAEFTAIEDAIESFRIEYEDGGGGDAATVYVNETVTGTTVTLDPANGSVQTLPIGDTDSVIITIAPRVSGATFRMFVVIRCVRADTTFTVVGPDGHLFGLNQTDLIPSQVENNGFYASAILVTYGTGGTFVQVFADNTEATATDAGDFLTAKAL